MSRSALSCAFLSALAILLAAPPPGAAQSRVLGELPSRRPRPPVPNFSEKVELDGTLEIFIEDRIDESRQLTFLISDAGERYELAFDSEPAPLQTGQRVRVRGLRTDHVIAVSSAAGDIDQLSGVTAKSTQSAAALPNTFGEQRTVVLMVNFADKKTQPFTTTYARDVAFTSTSNYDLENSYGQTWLTGDVFGWYTIALSSTVCDSSTLANQARSAATAAGVNLSPYTRYVYAFPDNACSWGGLGTIGGSPSQAWINGSFQVQAMSHEMGHNFGLYHSHSLDCGSATLGGTCTTVEYGDTLDTMGSFYAYHYNAFQKERLGWLAYGSSPPITMVTASGTYSIETYETVGSAPKALKIAQGTTGNFFYVELRQGIGFDADLASNANVSNGVVVHLAAPQNANSSDLLDMTPATSTWSDPALTVGQSFTDSSSGTTITVNSVTSTGASVTVTLSSSTAPPSVALTSPAAGSTVSGSVSVTASASGSAGIARVDFYRDSGVLLGSSTSAPYGVAWNTSGVSPGNHSLYAVAVDTAGKSGTSAAETVTVASGDTTTPTASITNPVNGATVARRSTVTVTAAASDNVGVTRVDFFVNGTLLSSVTASPFRCAWKVPGKANGVYGLQAKAYDAAGNVGASAVVTVYAR